MYCLCKATAYPHSFFIRTDPFSVAGGSAVYGAKVLTGIKGLEFLQQN